MASEPLNSQLPPAERLRQNPKVNMSVVAAHKRLEKELQKLGVEIKPSYNIEPAFGLHPARFHNHIRSKTRKSLEDE